MEHWFVCNVTKLSMSSLGHCELFAYALIVWDRVNVDVVVKTVLFTGCTLRLVDYPAKAPTFPLATNRPSSVFPLRR